MKDCHLNADVLSKLRNQEKQHDVKPEYDLDAFMKAQATEGKNGSVNSELMLRLLGLQVTCNTKAVFNAAPVTACTGHGLLGLRQSSDPAQNWLCQL